MTNHVKIQGVTPRIQYVADGTSTDYEFPFAIFTSDDLDVYLDDTLQSTTTYTVNGIRHSDGGTVSFDTAPAIDTVITIVRNLTIERTTDFQEGGALRADVLNDELDYQIACQQQIAENLNRSFVLAPYANSDDVDLNLPPPDAGKAIVWNSSGTGLENSSVTINTWGPILTGYKQSAETAAATATSAASTATAAASSAASSASSAADAVSSATTAAQNAATSAQTATTAAQNAATSATAAQTAAEAAAASAASAGSSSTGTTPASATDSSTAIATTQWIENQRQSGYGIGLPNWSAGIVLSTGTLHTIPSNGWIMSVGSVRLNSNTGKQVASGGATTHVPLHADISVYVSGAAATFFPSL